MRGFSQEIHFHSKLFFNDLQKFNGTLYSLFKCVPTMSLISIGVICCNNEKSSQMGFLQKLFGNFNAILITKFENNSANCFTIHVETSMFILADAQNKSGA
jgi:thiosulfate reductase cytochrome b subunit